jgi:hypothetical protein
MNLLQPKSLMITTFVKLGSSWKTQLHWVAVNQHPPMHQLVDEVV